VWRKLSETLKEYATASISLFLDSIYIHGEFSSKSSLILSDSSNLKSLQKVTRCSFNSTCRVKNEYRVNEAIENFPSVLKAFS
jgi:hypothetical protein